MFKSGNIHSDGDVVVNNVESVVVLFSWCWETNYSTRSKHVCATVTTEYSLLLMAPGVVEDDASIFPAAVVSTVGGNNNDLVGWTTTMVLLMSEDQKSKVWTLQLGRHTDDNGCRIVQPCGGEISFFDNN